MSTITLIFVGIWNGLLFAGLAFVLIKRRRLLNWVTKDDGEDRSNWERRNAWDEFLAEHPELTDDTVRVHDEK